MGHSREPVGYTCPAIDAVIDYMKNLEGVEVTDMDVSEIVWRMEELRGENDELRTWGNEEADRVDVLERKCDGLEDEKEFLVDRVDELAREINERDEKIEELEGEVNDLLSQIKRLESQLAY